MEIRALRLGYIGVNCYLVSTEKAAVVIDPGFKNEKVTEFLQKNSNKEKIILLTHAHFDHIGGADDLRSLTNTKIAIGEFDAEGLKDTNKNLSDRFHAKLKPFSADILLKNDDEFYVGDIHFKVIHTPGHTSGGVCFLTDDILFSGDTLFFESVGRTDFFDGDAKALEKSVKELYKLNDNTRVLPGHGPETTILHEKKNNPFVRG